MAHQLTVLLEEPVSMLDVSAESSLLLLFFCYIMILLINSLTYRCSKEAHGFCISLS